ncbi:Mvb12 superfamily protein [Kluyveromyces marxianus]|uniref:Mvb12 super family protein n=2 Tax=Kluyveromyces marxianus TaxID=4911 RepID=W0TCM4_KLUMD|nr:mvb12 super family protein [Kluyveromyces marxianus DMKU3-1042]QGN17485.1 mvb12 super family protein [Kluyveromyces marxianus]BAO41372.1 mvb12 super family protein [Kluyveromyces marxianus DMKU3-1042]
MDQYLRKVVLYHSLESSEKWPKARRKLNLGSLQVMPDAGTQELAQVAQICDGLSQELENRRKSEQQFDQWYQETYLASKPKGLLEQLAPKRRA